MMTDRPLFERRFTYLSICFVAGLILVCCNSVADYKTKEVAEAQCSACHIMPDPQSLTKEIWEKSIIPRMSLYYAWDQPSSYPYANRSVGGSLNNLPMNDKTWDQIVKYYRDNSPTEIEVRPPKSLPTQTFFEETTISSLCGLPAVTALTIEADGTILSACGNQIFQLSGEQPIDTLLTTPNTISQIQRKSSTELFLLNIGKLGPHDQPLGSLDILNLESNKVNPVLDSLFRPVFMNFEASKLYLSQYGNAVGQFSELDLKTNRHTTIAHLPGSYRSFIMDVDNDDITEIIVQFSQANEGVFKLKEVQDRIYEIDLLLSFPPQFGFSDIDTADVNRDGFVDLIITNGDNADYSNIPKNYHGVRIYLNDKNGGFDESLFYPIYGATQVKCVHVDEDQSIDLVIASYFPLDSRFGITLLRNTSQNELSFEPYQFANGDKGRWLVMEDGDIDNDGDEDIVLGSFVSGPSKIAGSKLDDWLKESVDLLVLKNLRQ